MTLDELKVRLKITDAAQDDYLTVALEDALDYVKQHCRQDFADGLPANVKQAVAKLVKAYQENSHVSSQSLGGVSESFFEGAAMNEIHQLLKPYKRMRFL